MGNNIQKRDRNPGVLKPNNDNNKKTQPDKKTPLPPGGKKK